MSTLMDRIKTTDFLSQPIPTQLNLILSLQAMRIEGLKNAADSIEYSLVK